MATLKTSSVGVAFEPAATGFSATGGTTTQKTLTISESFTVDAAITNIEDVADTMSDSDSKLATNAAIIDKIGAMMAAGVLTWATNTTTPIACAVQNGYIAALAAGGPLVYNLPAAAAVGGEVVIIGQGPELFSVVPDAADFIRFNNLITKAGGAVLSIAANDWIHLRAAVVDSVWQVVGSGGAFNVTIS